MNHKQEKENILINPNTSGYEDRKMSKWQGLILSEHNEIVKEEKINSRKVNKAKEKQTEEEISKVIDFSYRQKSVVAIQLDYVINGNYEDDILGVVYGYYEKNIYIQSLNSGVILCELDLIRNVEKYKLDKWFSV